MTEKQGFMTALYERLSRDDELNGELTREISAEKTEVIDNDNSSRSIMNSSPQSTHVSILTINLPFTFCILSSSLEFYLLIATKGVPSHS